MRPDRFDLDYVGPGKWVTMGGEFGIVKRFRPINPMESSAIPAKNRRHIFSVRDLRQIKVPGKFYELSPEIYQAARFQDIVPFLKERIDREVARSKEETEHPTEKPPQVVRVFPELREMREQMFGVLEEGWANVKSIFGVRNPLFRAAEMGARILWNLENGFEGAKRAKWDEPWDKGFGISMSRNLEHLITSGTFGSVIFVIDKDVVVATSKIIPVLSPTASDVIKNDWIGTVTKRSGPGADVRRHARSLHGAKAMSFGGKLAGNEAEERVVAKKVGPKAIKGIILTSNLVWGIALSKNGGLLPNPGLNLETLGVIKKAIELGIPVVAHGKDAGAVGGNSRWENPSEWNLVKFIYGTDEFYMDKAVGVYEYKGKTLDRPVSFSGTQYWPKKRIS